MKLGKFDRILLIVALMAGIASLAMDFFLK